MREKAKKKRLAILGVLRGSSQALGSAEIAERLLSDGHDISERTVRLYLKELDEEGLTRSEGRRGRLLTDRGAEDIDASRALERLGLLSAKIDRLTYLMDFDLNARSGSVIVNMTVADPAHLLRHAPTIGKVFEKGYSMGQLIGLLGPGERCGDVTVPPGMAGLITVCSITLNGVLLKHGIPVHSRFGGLLELRAAVPTRFVELINYDGTTVDPLEAFIRGGMTNYHGAVANGNGRIGAGFREFPAEARAQVLAISARLEASGLNGFLRIGFPAQPLLDIPVSDGSAGAIVIGGLNPVAILEESGIRVHSRALSGLFDFARLFPHVELAERVRSLARRKS